MRSSLAALALVAACRARDASPAGEVQDTRDVAWAPAATPRIALGDEAVPVRVAEGSQPRWRYLAHGVRPRGRERWRFDLTPREGTGEAATDGRTVYITAARREPEELTDGEVYAFDLRDGTLRWHTPVGGVHGEPLELFDGVVLVDTIPHCVRRGAETPGVLTRPCIERAPGGVVGIDASTGRERFRTTVSSETLHAGWTSTLLGTAAWVHDGAQGLRAVAMPDGALGARMTPGGSVLSLTALGNEALVVTRTQQGVTKLARTPMPTLRSPRAPRAPAVRPRWERALPLHTHCAPIYVGPLLVLPAFQTNAGAAATRALLSATGVDLWTGRDVPRRVLTCGAIEGGVHYQVYDDAIVGVAVADGRHRVRAHLPVVPSGNVSVLVDGVLYLGTRNRLVGLDGVDGHVTVSVETGAASVEAVVLWGGMGVFTTRDPGLVVGFD